MAFTYSGDPSASNRDDLRFTIGDTLSSDVLLTDAELDSILASNTSVKGAAVVAVRRIIAIAARQVTKSVGDLRLNLSDRVKQYKILLKELQYSLSLSTAGPIAGGISKSRKETVKEDSDRVIPDFQKGQFDIPGAGNTTRINDNEILN